jgi:hypothetical protein
MELKLLVTLISHPEWEDKPHLFMQITLANFYNRWLTKKIS